MKAVIMAGGEGTRLRPLTSVRPKPMVPVANHPVMEHIVGLCHWHGIDEIVATLQFMPQLIRDYFGDGEEWGVSLEYAVEDTPMGTAGSVKNAQALLGDDPVLVISGDALTDIDLAQVVDFHRRKGAAVTVALKRVADPLDFGVVITDAEDRIERFLEKPTWGQVFSDTINTGIYVIEPEVLDLIPDHGQFDFSGNLFPLLMERGYPLYGCVVDGYWTDIGSLDSYVRAHWDVFDEKVGIFVPGVKAANEVWIGEGTDISHDAFISDKVIIGSNVKIEDGACIGDYAVIGDSCFVGAGARIEHSIVWSDSFVGAGAQVGGAVLCRRTDIRKNARIETGAVVGDEATVGAGAVVGADVAVFPYKRIEAGAVQTSSLIWESRGARTLFGSEGVSGLIGVDITPELALRLAQAYGTTLPTGGHVVVSRDQSRGARMLKRAVAAGLNSAGINVRDLRVASSGVNRFTTRDSRCVGGVHLRTAEGEPRTLEIHFYDKAGLDISPGDEKRIERLYFRQEFRRSFFDQMGDIIYPARALEYYSAGMLDALGISDSRHRVRIPEPREPRLKAVAEMGFGVASIVAPQVAAGWGMDLIALRPFVDSERTAVTGAVEEDEAYANMLSTVDSFRADFGVGIDAAAERVRLVSPDGRLLDGDTALHAMVALVCKANPGTRVAIPLHASSAVEEVAGRAGCGVVRCGLTTRAMSVAGLEEDVGFVGDRNGGYMFPSFLAAFDAVMTLGMLGRLLADTGTRLDELVDSLPGRHIVEEAIACPPGLKGAVMREIAEASSGFEVQMTEGIRIRRGDAWVLVMPDSVEPRVTVYVDAAGEQDGRGLLDEYAARVKDVVEAGV